MPKLGLFEAIRESSMEGYNQVHNLFKHLSLSFSNSIWKICLGKKHPFTRKKIRADEIPSWMQRVDEKPAVPQQLQPSLPAKSLKVVWMYPTKLIKANDSKARELLQHLEDQLDFPPMEQVLQIYPDHTNDLYLRDEVHRSFVFGDLGIQFNSMGLYVDDSPPLQVYPKCDWGLVQSTLNKYSVPLEANLMLKFKARLMDEDEELFELTEPPLALSDIFQNVHQNVAPVAMPSSMVHQAITDTEAIRPLIQIWSQGQSSLPDPVHDYQPTE